MKARDCSPNASRWLFVTVLQILALLLLQSCKNDQSVREKAEIQAPPPSGRVRQRTRTGPTRDTTSSFEHAPFWNA